MFEDASRTMRPSLDQKANYALLGDDSGTTDAGNASLSHESRALNLRRLFWPTIASAAALMLAITALTSWAFKESRSVVDPLSLPGYLSYNASDPLAAAWIPHTSDDRVADWMEMLRTAEDLPYSIVDEHYGATWDDRLNWNSTERHTSIKPNMQKAEAERNKLQKAAVEGLSHLQDSTVLLIGDSIDRNTVWYTSQLLAAEDRLHRYRPMAVEEELQMPMIQNHASRALHRLEFDRLQFALASCFTYGNAEGDFFSFQGEWTRPGDAEVRVEEICRKFTQSIGRRVAMIQFQSGLWDLAYFGREDVTHNRSTYEPLDQERIDWWLRRTTSVIKKVKQLYPGVPIVYRTLHRPAVDEAYRDFIWDNKNATFVNFFTDVRAAQIRQMQIAVARQEGLRLWDFGGAFEGFQAHAVKVHPTVYPAGVLLTQAVLHYAWLVQQ